MNFFDQKSHQKQMRRKKVSKMKDFIQLWSIKLKLSLWRVCGRLSLIQVEFKHFLENELRTFIAIIFIAVRCNVSYMCKIHHCKLQKNLQTEDWKRMRCALSCDWICCQRHHCANLWRTHSRSNIWQAIIQNFSSLTNVAAVNNDDDDVC